MHGADTCRSKAHFEKLKGGRKDLMKSKETTFFYSVPPEDNVSNELRLEITGPNWFEGITTRELM